MARLVDNSKLSSESRRSASVLFKRLQTDVIAVGSAGANNAKSVVPVPPKISGRHCMVSYSWSCNKDLVVQLCRRLREANIDVWRDEEGSSILPEMKGATDDCMAEAIELSHTVIICVSNQCKCSANCRQEAKYANSLFKKQKLHLIYVMMDKNYTTVSSPECVDGWWEMLCGIHCGEMLKSMQLQLSLSS